MTDRKERVTDRKSVSSAGASCFQCVHARALLTHLLAGGRGYVGLQRGDIMDGLDRDQINTDDDAGDGHVLGRHLQPSAWGRAQVYQHSRLLEELELPIELNQFERRPGPVSGLLGQAIELVLSSFSYLCLLTHY